MITNTELIRRDLAATNHDIVVKPKTPLAKTWKAKHENDQNTKDQDQAEDQTSAARRDKGGVNRR